MRMRAAVACLLGGMAAACASTIEPPAPPDAYRLEIRDNPAAHRFDLVLQSYDDRALCLPVDDWPTGTGMLRVEGNDVHVETAAGRLPARSAFSSLYCPGGCGVIRIAPGDALEGFFAYDAFGDAGRLAGDASRRLRFSGSPYRCL